MSGGTNTPLFPYSIDRKQDLYIDKPYISYSLTIKGYIYVCIYMCDRRGQAHAGQAGSSEVN